MMIPSSRFKKGDMVRCHSHPHEEQKALRVSGLSYEANDEEWLYDLEEAEARQDEPVGCFQAWESELFAIHEGGWDQEAI